MDCKEAEELLIPYLLGTLEPQERETLGSHLDTCPGCRLKLDGEGETLTRLAFSAPRREAPPRVRQRLLSRIEEDQRPGGAERAKRLLRRLATAPERAFLPHAARAAASVMLLGLIFGGVWFNARISQVSDDREQPSESLESAAQGERVQDVARREARSMEGPGTQRYLAYEAMRMSAAPGASVNMLWGTDWTAEARGMMMVSRTGAEALLLVIDLPPLAQDKVYQVWLIKGGQRYNGGLLTVDSTGYGQTVIIPYVSIAEFEAIRITIEPEGGSVGPTGTSVLKGDL